MDVTYFEARFRVSVEKAESESDCCAHRSFAQAYLDKLSTLRGDLRSLDASQRYTPRVTFRHG
jgi:hypothetical protein